MKADNKLVELLLLAVLIIPAEAQTESFNNLEYGFSVDYPRELYIDVYDLGFITGIEDPVVGFSSPGVMQIYVGASEYRGLSLERIVSRAESDYEEAGIDFQVLSSTTKNINDVEALQKEYLLETQTTSGIQTELMKDVFLKGNNLVYHVSCRADESDYRRADLLYFQDFIESFHHISVDETVTGKRIQTARPIWSSPALADINEDGNLEIVVGTNEGKLYVWTKDGSRVSGFPVSAEDYIRSSPAVADLDGDGKMEIAVGSDDGMLYVWDNSGALVPGFPKLTAYQITSSPALGDLDEDGKMEIVVGSDDRGIYAWNSDGSPVCGFPVITGGSIWSSPALGDLDGDGHLDVVIGSRRLGEDIISMLFGAYTGQIYSVGFRGDLLAEFPRDLASPTVSDLRGSSISYSSPVLADLNDDGALEIIIGAENGLYVLDDEGEDVSGFPRKTGGTLRSNFPAVSDLDDDGTLEIVSGCGDGRLYVWRSDGSEYPGFPMQTGCYIRHVTLGDIDDDGEQEILGGSRDNRVHAWNLDGTEVQGFPKVTLDDVDTAPTLGDLEGDGSLEMVVGSDDGRIYIWTISDSYGRLDWPMIRQNLNHTGLVAKG